MAEALVNKILPFSSVDGPGNRTAIFFQGCNFNCLYCHNPETLSLNVDSGATFMTIEDIMRVVGRVRPFISGITVSGGECTLQKEFLPDLFYKVHALGLTAFVDTNGSIDFSQEPLLVDTMDKAMLDIKSFDEAEHRMLTGASNRLVLKNAEYLAKLGKLYEIRTVIVPKVLDNSRNVAGIAGMIAQLNPDIRYKLIKFRPMGVIGEMKDHPGPTDELMQELGNLAEDKGCRNVTII